MRQPIIDFNLHDLASVRLLNATDGDQQAVGRQLGVTPSLLNRDPDITLRFVDDLPLDSTMRLLGVNEFGFDRDGFYGLRGANKAPVKVRIPVDELGDPCEFICESGLNTVPLLIAAINLRILVRGQLPLHASAFVAGGKGILCAGWSKGGKTETLLGFMAHGARYIGDEWVYLDGQRMQGIPEPMHVWDWHLTELPEFRARLTRRARQKLFLLRQVRAALDGLSHLPLEVTNKLVRPLVPRVRSKCYAKVAPARLFGSDRLESNCSIDHLLFVQSHAADSYHVEPIASTEVAQRMTYSLQEERLDLVSLHHYFRFAFPERENRWIPRMEAMQRERLVAFLADCPAHAVYHPYPMQPNRLYEVIRPVLAG